MQPAFKEFVMLTRGKHGVGGCRALMNYDQPDCSGPPIRLAEHVGERLPVSVLHQSMAESALFGHSYAVGWKPRLIQRIVHTTM
jgi:hypothetical protein